MTLPSACGLIVLGEPIIRLIYVRGAFKESDVPMTALALAGYSIGLTGYAAIKVLSPAFYALDDAKTPMMIALASIVVNAVASFFFRNWLSGVGVTPESPSGYGHVGVFSSFVRIAIASLVMSVVAYFSYRLLTNYFAVKTLLIKLIEAFVPIGLGGLSFLIAAKLLRIQELEKLYNNFRRKLR